jgi:cytoskeleton protein RodZ
MQGVALDQETDLAQTPLSAAAMMHAAREKAGLSLAEVAAKTRIPLRHLEAMERGEFSALPGITYCAGFARAFARAVNADEVLLVARVRDEVENAGDSANDGYRFEEAVDPARVPPRALAWTVGLIIMVLAGGYGFWRMQVTTPSAEPAEAPPPATAKPAQRTVQATAPAPAVRPEVVLTATDDVWLRIYEKDGPNHFLGVLKKGDRYVIPADAANPLILSGRPDALAVTVGGRGVAPLGTGKTTIADFPVGAEALLARAIPASPPVAAPAPAVSSVPPAASPVTASVPTAPRTQTTGRNAGGTSDATRRSATQTETRKPAPVAPTRATAPDAKRAASTETSAPKPPAAPVAQPAAPAAPAAPVAPSASQ